MMDLREYAEVGIPIFLVLAAKIKVKSAYNEAKYELWLLVRGQPVYC